MPCLLQPSRAQLLSSPFFLLLLCLHMCFRRLLGFHGLVSGIIRILLLFCLLFGCWCWCSTAWCCACLWRLACFNLLRFNLFLLLLFLLLLLASHIILLCIRFTCITRGLGDLRLSIIRNLLSFFLLGCGCWCCSGHCCACLWCLACFNLLRFNLFLLLLFLLRLHINRFCILSSSICIARFCWIPFLLIHFLLLFGCGCWCCSGHCCACLWCLACFNLLRFNLFLALLCLYLVKFTTSWLTALCLLFNLFFGWHTLCLTTMFTFCFPLFKTLFFFCLLGSFLSSFLILLHNLLQGKPLLLKGLQVWVWKRSCLFCPYSGSLFRGHGAWSLEPQKVSQKDTLEPKYLSGWEEHGKNVFWNFLPNEVKNDTQMTRSFLHDFPWHAHNGRPLESHFENGRPLDSHSWYKWHANDTQWHASKSQISLFFSHYPGGSCRSSVAGVCNPRLGICAGWRFLEIFRDSWFGNGNWIFGGILLELKANDSHIRQFSHPKSQDPYYPAPNITKLLALRFIGLSGQPFTFPFFCG